MKTPPPSPPEESPPRPPEKSICLVNSSIPLYLTLNLRQNFSQICGLAPSGVFSGASSSSIAFSILTSASGAKEPHRRCALLWLELLSSSTVSSLSGCSLVLRPGSHSFSSTPSSSMMPWMCRFLSFTRCSSCTFRL
ncbi:hypothetical protein EYF80_007949 [Liparis tanakae]|uniref:Uncharacterized protein n=1 Tax=Liparis tanakae TaxID=230148 RepID=A0A4Z2IV18_9TELE|nr:hypothetical protein EYF80_007949 [Liparis tanakae]